MTDTKNNKPKSKSVDDAGIRLAPTPMRDAGYQVMPQITQEFVIRPQIAESEGGYDADGNAEQASTINDFQPKKEDANKRWKRHKRAKNMVVGAIELVVSLLMLLPYVLGAVEQAVDFPIVISFDEFNVIGHIVEAFKFSAEFGWTGDEVLAVWLYTIPDFMLTIGILCILINVIKSFFGLFGAVRPVKYTVCSAINFACVCAILIMTLVGAPALGVAKIDFIQDFIHGYGTSETFTLVVLGAGYLLVGVILSFVNRDKYGYLK